MSATKSVGERVRTDFGKSSRMRRSDEFSAVLARRQVMRGDQVVVHYAPNARASARLGLIVGRKMDRRAVARNHFKRVVREAFRMVRPQLPPIDIVVRASAPLRNPKRAELRCEINALLSKLGR